MNGELKELGEDEIMKAINEKGYTSKNFYALGSIRMKNGIASKYVGRDGNGNIDFLDNATIYRTEREHKIKMGENPHINALITILSSNPIETITILDRDIYNDNNKNIQAV